MNNIGNSAKEAEYISSKLLIGQEIPKNYQMIRILLSKLPDLSIITLTPEISKLKKKLFDNLNLIKDSEAESFLKGTNQEVYDLLVSISHKVVSLISALINSYHTSERLQMQEIDDKVNQMKEFEDLRKIIPNSPTTFEQDNMKDILKQCNLFVTYAKKILPLYGTGKISSKVPKKIHKVSELTIFLMGQDFALSEADYDISVMLSYKQILDTLRQNIVLGSLNPFNTDLLMNMYEVFLDPKGFYTKCKLDNVISPIIGQAFYNCFKQFYLQFAEIATENLDEVPYQEKISILQGLGITQNISQLITLYSDNINVITNPGNAAQGV